MIKRLKEPSTYAGLGLIALGLDKVFDINEAVTFAQFLEVGGVMIAGFFAAILKEKN